MKQVLIGTSGFNYRDWKGRFYPQDLVQSKWLAYYSEQFRTVEINATFYRSFSAKVFSHWAEKVPNDFCFSIKGPRFITHLKQLHDVEESIEQFFLENSGLGKKLGVVLWQFAGRFTLEKDRDEKLGRFERFLSLLPKHIPQVVELRHTSWFTDDFFSLLHNYNIGFVINDSSVFPAIEKVTGNSVYIRFHGPKELYSSKYSDEQMRHWAEKIKTYRKSHTVYCYFNNDMKAVGVDNAKTLDKFLSSHF